MSDVVEEEVHWLWPPYLPSAKLCILEGAPGLGKSAILTSLAAAISRGGAMKGDGGNGYVQMEQGKVLFLSGEDDLGDTVKPRLRVAGADMNNVVFFDETERGVYIHNVAYLDAMLEQVKPQLFCIDPITCHLGSDVDMHRASETGEALRPLRALALKHGCCILITRHLARMERGYFS